MRYLSLFFVALLLTGCTIYVDKRPKADAEQIVQVMDSLNNLPKDTSQIITAPFVGKIPHVDLPDSTIETTKILGNLTIDTLVADLLSPRTNPGDNQYQGVIDTGVIWADAWLNPHSWQPFALAHPDSAWIDATVRRIVREELARQDSLCWQRVIEGSHFKNNDTHVPILSQDQIDRLLYILSRDRLWSVGGSWPQPWPSPSRMRRLADSVAALTNRELRGGH